MNTEDSEFQRIEREAKLRSVYITGCKESRQLMPAQRKPLTYQEIWNAIRPLTKSDEVCTALVQVSMAEYRAIEAAHGIKEKSI